MNKEQLNSLALKVNSGGEISDLDLYKLADTAGVDYFSTFKGVENVSGDLLNQMLNLAHKNNKVELAKKRVATNQVKITDSHYYLMEGIKSLGNKAERLSKELNDDLQKDSYARFDSIAGDIWKSRMKNKKDSK